MTKTSCRTFCYLYVLLSAAGCGWQLRGTTAGDGAFNVAKQAQIEELYLVGQSRNTSVYRNFLNVLQQQGIENREGAELVVQLSKERISRKPLSYGSTGSAAQYQMTVSIEYQVSRIRNQQASPLVSQRKIVTRRNYDFDPDQIISKDREQEELIKEMREQLARQILTSIQQAL